MVHQNGKVVLFSENDNSNVLTRAAIVLKLKGALVCNLQAPTMEPDVNMLPLGKLLCKACIDIEPGLANEPAGEPVGKLMCKDCMDIEPGLANEPAGETAASKVEPSVANVHFCREELQRTAYAKFSSQAAESRLCFSQHS